MANCDRIEGVAQADMWSVQEVLSTAQSVRDYAGDRYVANGSLPILTFLCATRHPETGQEGAGLISLPQVFDMSEDGKTLQSNLIRHAVAATAAIAVINVMETWHVPNLAPEDQDQWRGRLDEHPDRQEALFMFVEHARFGTRCWRTQIIRDAHGHAKVGEWVEVEGFRKVTGRFAQMLPRTN